MIHYQNCPVCKSEHIHPVLSATDHTVTNKSFAIWHCNECTARFTQDVPGEEAIGSYYGSEDYVSHSDTRRGLVNRLYHLVRKRTLQTKRRLVINETGRMKGELLDIGSGTGAFLHNMKEAGWETIGLEPDTQARRKSAQLYSVRVLEPGNIFELHPGIFHAITMWHVLEHVHDLHAYLSKISLLLAPGGKLFIAVPNYTSYDAAVYKENWAAWDVPRHLYHFSPRSMKKLLEAHGLRILSCKRMAFDSFYIGLLSERNRKGGGNMFRGLWNGLVSNLKALASAKHCSSVIYVAGHE